MSESLRALILGIIQGLTEFLPVSSSGHLELGKFILGDNSVGEESLVMTVVLHFATALATVIVFRKDIAEIFKGLFSGNKEDVNFALKIIVSMIPAAVIGVLFEEQLEALFGQRLGLVGVALIATGLLLFLADRAKNTDKKVGFMDSVIIGVAQAIAMIPGISRSGATISTSVLLGIDRERSARFSFLMVVPLIFGKIAKDLISGEFSNGDINVLPLVIGFFAALVTGYFACVWMIQLVKRSKLSYFAIYCMIVGVAAIVYSTTSL